MWDVLPDNWSFVPGEDPQLFYCPFTTNATRSLFVSPGRSLNTVTPGNTMLMHNGPSIGKHIQNVSCQEELCPHLLFPWGLISVHIRNNVEKANECCWPSLHVLSVVLSPDHNGARAGQSLTRLPVSPRTSRDPWGLTDSVCLPADPDNWGSWPLCSLSTSSGR